MSQLNISEPAGLSSLLTELSRQHHHHLLSFVVLKSRFFLASLRRRLLSSLHFLLTNKDTKKTTF